MRVALYLTLEPDRGRTTTLARVEDPELVVEAATVALEEAECRIEREAAVDAIYGELQKQEVNRLRQALQLVIPELRQRAEMMVTAVVQ
jgi:hypothetical protein